MQIFLDLKRLIDVFIYVLRSNTGYVLVIFAMIAVQLYGTSNYFMLVMKDLKSSQIHSEIPNIGFLFACCLEAGIFATAIWGLHKLSISFAICSGFLSLASFKDFFLLYSDVTKWNLSIIINLSGILVIAIFPAAFIATLSYQLYKNYEKEGFKTLEKMLDESSSYFSEKRSNPKKQKTNFKVTLNNTEKIDKDFFKDAI